MDEAWGEDFECKPYPCKYGCSPLSVSTHRIHSVGAAKPAHLFCTARHTGAPTGVQEAKPPFNVDKKTPYIMLIDRGPGEIAA